MCLDGPERATVPTILGLLGGLDNAERAILLTWLITVDYLGRVDASSTSQSIGLPADERLGRWHWVSRRMLISNLLQRVNWWTNVGPESAKLRAKKVLDGVTLLITSATPLLARTPDFSARILAAAQALQLVRIKHDEPNSLAESMHHTAGGKKSVKALAVVLREAVVSSGVCMQGGVTSEISFLELAGQCFDGGLIHGSVDEQKAVAERRAELLNSFHHVMR